MFLRCNNQMCFNKLINESFITNCNHIFCTNCCKTILRTERCLTCNFKLRRRDIKESELLKNILGQNPLSLIDGIMESVRFYLKNKEYEIHIYNQELIELRRKYDEIIKQIKGIQDVHLIEKQLMEEKIFNLEKELRKINKEKYEEIISTEIKLVNENYQSKYESSSD